MWCVVLWIRGYSFGKRNYKAIFEFTNAAGIQKADVQYRGVKVGKISAVRPGPNGVEVESEILHLTY
jgi:phospholipid/cholesterol/gamma-HCH transport system substrate-binding protein